MSKVRKGKREEGGVFSVFALCLLLAFGLFLIFLKIRAFNTELLVKNKMKQIYKLTLKKKVNFYSENRGKQKGGGAVK